MILNHTSVFSFALSSWKQWIMLQACAQYVIFA